MVRRSKTIAGFENDALARSLARKAGADFVTLALRQYPAGEYFIAPLKPIRSRAVLVTDIAADALSVWRAALAANALRHAGARSVALVAPWISYGRQDRPSRDAGGVAGEALGGVLRGCFDRVVTVSAHSRQFMHSIGRATSLDPTDLITSVAERRGITAVAAPDHGAIERARRIARRMRLPLIFCEKKRSGSGLFGVKTQGCTGDAKGYRVLLVDDMVDSGGTLKQASIELRRMGAQSVSACVTHLADPSSQPRASDLGLRRLDILYTRTGPPGPEFIALLADAL